MVERGNRITRTSGMSTWRAGCSGTGTSGSEGGSGKPTSREAGRAPRPDPYAEHPTREGKLYCAVVLDACSRRVVGWSMADHLRTELILDALDMAIAQRNPTAGLVHHSHHGCQPRFAFGRRLAASELVASMGTVGDALDNAVAESFFATMDCELLDRYPWPTRAGLRTAIFDFIEVFYNRQRRHSILDYHPPTAYEHHHASVASAA